MQRGARYHAKELGEKTYLSDSACKQGHVSLRDTKTGSCLVCKSMNSPKYSRTKYLKHKDKIQQQHREYRQNNLEKDLENKRKYYQKNKEKTLEYQKWYRENNRDKDRAWKKAYKERKRNRTPEWLTNEHKAQILEFYTKAENLTKITGIVHQVDHIVPLRGSKVSGLHVPWNLQILTKQENTSKRNRFG